MTFAQAVHAVPQFTEPAARAPRLRLLTADSAPRDFVQRASASGHTPPAGQGKQALLWVLLVAGLHAALVAGVWQRDTAPKVLRAPQEIELLRPARVVLEKKVEPPPPPKRVEPPKAIEPPKPTAPPQAALRTQAAEAPVPNTMTVAENLTAAKTTGPVAAVPTPPPAPAPRVEEPITEPSGYAGYLNNPAPVYPKAAQRLGMQGRVLLRVRVLASGQVSDVEVKQSSGKTLLDEAALAAVRTWTFAPAKRGNTPIDAWTQVPIDFKIAQ